VSHNASAESFMMLGNADRLGAPVYAQVQQMFAQLFSETMAPASKKALHETYQAKSNTALDQAIVWNKIKPEMGKKATATYTE
ncbi:hypothetical protein RA265_28810, partial [Pseudomonas syringae pv. tagetis]